VTAVMIWVVAGLIVGGGFLALDHAALGQFMLSRPLVAATLGGAVVGDPLGGAVVGILLEGLHVAHLPAGGARLPDPGPGSLVAGVVAGTQGRGIPAGLDPLAGGASAPDPAGALALALFLGVSLSLLGGVLVGRHRARNARVVARVVDSGGTMGPALRGALFRGWARGAVLVVLGLGAAALVSPAAQARWPLPWAWTVALLALPALLGVGAVGRTPVPGPRKRGRLLLLGGTVAGLVAGWALGLGPVGGGSR
jgi:hypothetical protein